VTFEWTFPSALEFCNARFEIANTAHDENSGKNPYDENDQEEGQIQYDDKKLT
jgi:hypothetical protein